MRVHPGSVDIEVPEGNVVQAIHVIEGPVKELVGYLRSAVERAILVGVMTFRRRKVVRRTVNGR